MLAKPLAACSLALLLACASPPGSDDTGTDSGQTTSDGGSETSSSSSDADDSSTATDDTSDTGGGCDEPHPYTIPLGSAVTVDGAIGAGEWDDAEPFVIAAGAGWEVPVRIKNDGESFLFAFTGLMPPQPPPVGFPELLVDVQDDKAATWQSDDWWFHVSLNDCHGIGKLDDYSTCVPEAAGWEANNFPQGQLVDVVEIRVPFATIGWSAGLPPEIGLALRLSDTQGWAVHWPADVDPASPATWPSFNVCAQ